MKNPFIRLRNFLRYQKTIRAEKQAKRAFLKKARKLHCRIDKEVKIGGARYVSIGKDSTICYGSSIGLLDHCYQQKTSPSLAIGHDVWIGPNSEINLAFPCVIEDNVTLAPSVFITNTSHGFDPEKPQNYRNQPLNGKSMLIGKNAFVGTKSILLNGVSIGEGAIVGAGSIVTKSVPPFTMVAGNPAHVIKKYSFDHHAWEKVD
jgi:acetyltransferase-like isoleucine patch superfamily enzyme